MLIHLVFCHSIQTRCTKSYTIFSNQMYKLYCVQLPDEEDDSTAVGQSIPMAHDRSSRGFEFSNASGASAAHLNSLPQYNQIDEWNRYVCVYGVMYNRPCLLVVFIV